jgi:hypothetical protein
MTPTTPPEDRPEGADDETQLVPAAPPIAPEPSGERAGSGRRIDRWSAPPPNARPYRSSFIGMAGLATMLFIILASGSVLPWYVVAALTIIWAAALVRGTKWFLTNPTKVLLLPLLMLVIWLAALMGGALLFGWGT